MKHATILTLSTLGLALAACGKSAEPVGEATTDAMSGAMATEPAMGDPAMAPAATGGQAFANAAAASDMFEIESSKLASEKASAAKVKTFAQNMVKAHTESTAKLKTAAASASPAITPQPALDAMQQQTLDTLRSKSGADFDTAYIKAQVDAHQTTLDALRAYSTSGEVPQLKAFAGEMVPIVTGHLNMAKGL